MYILYIYILLIQVWHSTSDYVRLSYRLRALLLWTLLSVFKYKYTLLEDPESGKDDLTDEQLTPREEEGSAKPNNDPASTSTEDENQEKEKKIKPKR